MGVLCTPASVGILGCAVIQQTSRLCFLPWNTGPKPPVTRKVSAKNCTGSRAPSYSVAVASSRFSGLSVKLKGSLTPCRENPTSVACLSSACPTFSNMCRVLSKHNVKMFGLPPKNVLSFVWLIKGAVSWPDKPDTWTGFSGKC